VRLEGFDKSEEKKSNYLIGNQTRVVQQPQPTTLQRASKYKRIQTRLEMHA
jgi:hypothetical protein